jgi:V8-like Glu-specific endopeptidase
MKTLQQNFRQLILVGLITILVTSQTMGQVTTRVLSPDDRIENYIPWYKPEEQMTIINTPLLDVDAVLEEDVRNGREFPRISIEQDVNLSTNNGQFTQRGNYLVWNMTLNSENANSLSIGFNNISLPEKAIMFMYSQESNFIFGPIRNNNFYNNTFISDYIDGEQVIISIFIPSPYSADDLEIDINSIYFGLESYKSFDDDFNTSGSCNINVACDNSMGCQKNSVCKVITGVGACSGVLVNNDCCDLTPYILTANHCLINAGTNPNTWNFRFNYESPECSTNIENSPSQWITYFGANSRASWEQLSGTDFLLLELISDIGQGSGVSFSGWERSNPNTSNSIGIHHPSGDVKKICYDTNPSTISGNYHRVVWDSGTTEGGSSGSPLFNADSKIIGQLRGGFASCSNQSAWDEYGRFDLSWEGNGTNTSRLRNWLGKSSNPNSFDCMDNPLITGPDVLCSQAETFILINNMPCIKNVQWEVKPSNLLSSSSSGNGNSATVWAKPNVKGPATITFTLTSNGCEPIEIEKKFWIGSPHVLTSYPDPTICLGQFEQIVIPESLGANQYHLESLSPHLWISNNSPIPYSPIDIFGNQIGTFQLKLTVTNECGTSSAIIYVTVERCTGDDKGGFEFRSATSETLKIDDKLTIFPNPSNKFINVICKNCASDSKMNISILSLDGRVIQSNFHHGNATNVDLPNILSGIYILQVDIEGQKYHQKILKL